MEEKEIKTILAILFDIQKDIRRLKKHLGVKSEKKEEEKEETEEKEEKRKKREIPPELEAYPTAEEILREKLKENEEN
jgi:hypothetical protein